MKLHVEPRLIHGKAVKALRNKGLVPAVIYGRHMETPVSITIDKVRLVKAYHKTGMSTPLQLQGEGVNELVLFHDIQLDPVSDHVIHVDFLAVNKDEKVHAEVPVILAGVSPYEKSGEGKISLVKDKVEVEALPLDLPHDITIDISTIASVDDVVHVSDLKVSDKVKILDDEDLTILTVVAFRAEAEEDEVTAEDLEGTDEAGEGSAEESDDE